jgi:L-fucose mutarotase
MRIPMPVFLQRNQKMLLLRSPQLGDASLRAQNGRCGGVAAMLKNIDPLLSPEMLSLLRAMGHGDELAIVDANYPAVSSGRPVIRADGSQVTTVAAAVLSLMPLDEFVPCAAFHMQVVDNPDGQLPIFEEFRALLRKHEPRMAKLEGIERFAFYERVKKCFAVVATGERRLYGNLILKKGIVRPD